MRLACLLVLVTSVTALAETPYFARGDEVFQEALISGDAAVVRTELAAGRGDVDSLGQAAGTPLAVAVFRGHVKVVAVLLQFKADVTLAQHAELFPDGWNLRCGARLHGTAIDAMLAKAKAPPPTTVCLTDLKLVLAAKKGSEREVLAAKFPDGLSLSAAGLALRYAIASKKPAVVTAVIEVSGNPRLPEHANFPWLVENDPKMRRALGEVERRGIPEFVE